MTTSTRGTTKTALGRLKYPRIRVSLVLSEIDCPPEDLTDLLGIIPTKISRAGDPVVKAKPNGPKVKYDLWIIDSVAESTTELAEHVQSVVNVIGDNTDRFGRLSPGIRVLLHCSVFDNERSVVMQILPDQLRTIADIGAQIDIDYYDMTEVE